MICRYLIFKLFVQYEDAMQRDIRLIYEGQTAIHHIISNLDAKLQQIIQQQQQHTHLLNSAASGSGAGTGTGTGGVPAIDTFKRHEVNEVLQLNRELSSNIKDVRLAFSVL